MREGVTSIFQHNASPNFDTDQSIEAKSRDPASNPSQRADLVVMVQNQDLNDVRTEIEPRNDGSSLIKISAQIKN